MIYKYGYYVTASGEKRREVLGSVGPKKYEAKRAEIDNANFVSQSQDDKNTTWFIEIVSQPPEPTPAPPPDAGGPDEEA